jgi:F-type H+-transporting ATPase subunit delta
VNPSSIARRYAKALFELAAEEGRVDEVGAQLAELRVALDSDPDLLAALRSPASREQRLALAEALVAALKASPTLANTLRLLADRARLAQLGEVEAVFRALADERAGRIRARVVSAVPLSDDAAARVSAALAQATHRNVVLERAVDSEILGGLVAQVGSKVFDASIRNQIAQLRRQLKA